MRFADARRLAKASGVRGWARTVFFGLLSYVHRSPEVYPSQQEMAETLGVTDRTVRAALAQLEAAGLIQRTGARIGRAVVYRLAGVDAEGEAVEADPFRKEIPESGAANRNLTQRTRNELPPKIYKISHTHAQAREDGFSGGNGREPPPEPSGDLAAPSLALLRQLGELGRRLSEISAAVVEAAPRAQGGSPCPWLSAEGAPDVDAMLAADNIARIGRERGMSDATLHDEARRFLIASVEAGALWRDWSQQWWVWASRWNGRQAAAPKPKRFASKAKPAPGASTAAIAPPGERVRYAPPARLGSTDPPSAERRRAPDDVAEMLAGLRRRAV